MILFHFFIF
ncbi:unnamed protein product [Cuscuta epithymum]|uniref:Uncharacterized protein n=1 Tax=Cuscuta epithymum TaxID=186058 RepID=A0AAV0FH65_9ASTE|nr:unnamed protein product [Cuscuta epithymum]